MVKCTRVQSARFVLSALTLYCLCPAGAWAKTGAKPRKTETALKSTSAAEATASQGQALGISTAAPRSVEELMAHFQEIDKRLQSLSARYTQSVHLAEAGISHEIAGAVDYQQPDKLRIEHSTPERQTIVVDGQYVWIYRQSLNQVIQSKLESLRKSDPTMDNLMALGNYAQLLGKYDVSFDSTTQTATLRSKAGNAGIVLRLVLEGPEHFPARTEFTADQTEIRMSLADIRFNPKLDPQIFRFSPPQGADVFQDFKMPLLHKEER